MKKIDRMIHWNIKDRQQDGNDHNDRDNDDYCGDFDFDSVDDVADDDEVVDDDDDSSALVPKTDTGCTVQCCKAILGFCQAALPHGCFPLLKHLFTN